MDWRAFIWRPEIYNKLRSLAKRSFPASSDAEAEDAEEAFNYALDGITKDNFERLKGYRGECTPTGFMSYHFKGLLVDFMRHKYGRLRPPSWCKRIGEICKTVFHLLCVRGLEPEVIVDRLTHDGALHPEGVREMIDQIKARFPLCGQKYEETELGDDLKGPSRGLEEAIERALQEEVEAILKEFLDFRLSDHDISIDPSADNSWIWNREAVMSLRDTLLTISPLERLILKLIYTSEIRIPRVARELSLAEHQVRTIYRTTMHKLRSIFEKVGLADYFKLPDERD